MQASVTSDQGIEIQIEVKIVNMPEDSQEQITWQRQWTNKDQLLPGAGNRA